MEIFTTDEAMGIIGERNLRLHKPRQIAVIDAAVTNPGRLSTVAKEKRRDGYWYIEITRAGAISADVIKEVALECRYEGIIFGSVTQ